MAPLRAANGRIKMRVLVDRCPVEVFGNDGLASVTDLIFPDPDSDGVEVYASGGNARLASFDAFRLDSI